MEMDRHDATQNPRHSYVKVDDEWTNSHKMIFMEQFKKDIGKYHESNIENASMVKRKKLYGFDGGKEHTFIMIKFKTEMAMKAGKRLWYKKERLKTRGYVVNNCGTILYEAQIPPVLRLFHIRSISPSGWISLPTAKTSIVKATTTSCDYEFEISYKYIKPLPDKETMVPYKIASFEKIRKIKYE